MSATTWIYRFTEALTLLCGGKRPTDRAVKDWFNPSIDSFELQEFAIKSTPLTTAQGIAIIDAATHIADNPEEGVNHEMRDDSCSHGVRHPHECKQCADEPSDAEIDEWARAQGMAGADGNGESGDAV